MDPEAEASASLQTRGEGFANQPRCKWLFSSLGQVGTGSWTVLAAPLLVCYL